jgi:hypothetical protein
MAGDVKFEARVAPLVLAHSLAPFDSRILTSMPDKRHFLAPFFWLRLAFFAFKNQFVLSVLKS